jgi:cell wall-associated NlpC family hydrolase
MLSDAERTALCAEARTWLGTPYLHKAKIKGAGVDCGGFIHALFSPYAELPPMPDNYPPDWAAHNDAERYLDFIMPFVREVPIVRPAGFTLFHLGQAYSHAALMLDDGNYIHAWGRNREGSVTIMPPRIASYIAKKHSNGFRPKHFDMI